jgi:hypothetical protein
MENNIFTQVQHSKVQSNTFDLTHDRKFSGKMGRLIPIMVMDTVPGDKIKINSSIMLRFAPLIAPIMHRVNAYIHFFFVPNRLTYTNWEDFITGGENGAAEHVAPYVRYKTSDVTRGSLSDYLGLPVDGDTAPDPSFVQASALPYLAYQKIYNEYYRDQNLIPEVNDSYGDGQIPFWTDLQQLRTRSWQHDYFTSALPWTQKGPEAMLPLGDRAPIEAEDPLTFSMRQQFKRISDGVLIGGADIGSDGSGVLKDQISNVGGYIDLMNSHYTDLSQATASSINDLRRAMKLQEWLEKNARGGSRYIESIQVHFGVRSSDARLQRPEYLGGLKTPVKISEVLQTSSNDGQPTPQGNMSGHALTVGGGQKVGMRCEEHGYIIGILSVMPQPCYQQGIPKHFSRLDKFDYFWPSFANIGEQAILNKEIFVDNDEDKQLETFGYTPRYAEYKFMNNSVHGDFKQSLDFWHMGRKFANQPVLNKDFIEMDYTEVDRIFAVQDGTDNLWAQCLNKVTARRPMPIFGTPKF